MTTTITDVQFPGLVSGTWTIDQSHSEVGFTVRHLMSKVRGLFTSFEGELHISDNPLDSSAHATIDLASQTTTITVYESPMVVWIWIAVIIMGLGGLIALLPPRAPRVILSEAKDLRGENVPETA